MHLCDCPPNQEIEHPWKSPPVPLRSLSSSSSGNLQFPFCHYRWVLPVLECHVNGISQYVPFYGWLLSLSVVFDNLPCCHCASGPVHFIAESHSAVSTTQFGLPFSHGRAPGLLPLSTIINKATGTFLDKLSYGDFFWVNTLEWNCKV